MPSTGAEYDDSELRELIKKKASLSYVNELFESIDSINKNDYYTSEKVDEIINEINNSHTEDIQNIENTIPYVIVNGDREKRLPGNANISFRGVDRNRLLQELDSVGICASSGSACSAGKLTSSHVLTEIGVPKIFEKGSLRITIGKNNTKEDVDYLIDSLIEIVNKIR
jgi:cysteine desulfurase